MRRRKMLKRIGTASTLALGVTGFATAADESDAGGRLTHAKISNEQGEPEIVTLEELRHRPDAPRISDLGVGTANCCDDSCMDCFCEDC